MTLQQFKEKTKGWINPRTGAMRYYVTGGHYIGKGRVFFSETQESAKYTWEIPGEGFFHAEKTYNGSLVDELRELFPEMK